ncbi:MAG: hypothetical protein B6241_15415 [Spirochaetaceae bacterium 4572_59]|nr:MAG: hypothetical protein B6241_15415 [Spirochaetaceae bacterium 4572_59]
MKYIRPVLIILLAVLIFSGCKRDLGLDGPSGTYLSLNLNLPERADSTGARYIHSESDILTVSLTYPGDEPIVAVFELNSSNPVEALTYTIQGTLYYSGVGPEVIVNDDFFASGYFLFETCDFSFKGGDPILLDDGSFSITRSTADLDLDEYLIFSITLLGEVTELYEMARLPITLIQNADDFKLVAEPEIFLDFIVKDPDGNALSGASYVVNEYKYEAPAPNILESGTTGENGRIFFQDPNITLDSTYSVTIEKEPFDSQTIDFGSDTGDDGWAITVDMELSIGV